MRNTCGIMSSIPVPLKFPGNLKQYVALPVVPLVHAISWLALAKDQEVFVNRLQGKEGSKVEFDRVLLKATDGKAEVGSPVLKSKVKATIMEHVKADKLIVFKKKRRKGYRVNRGHRQALTKIKIDSIS